MVSGNEYNTSKNEILENKGNGLTLERCNGSSIEENTFRIIMRVGL